MFGYLFLPRGFRVGAPVIGRRGGCPAPGAKGSIFLMDPNAHTKERKQPIHGWRVLLCYGPRQGNRDGRIRLCGDA